MTVLLSPQSLTCAAEAEGKRDRPKTTSVVNQRGGAGQGVGKLYETALMLEVLNFIVLKSGDFARKHLRKPWGRNWMAEVSVGFVLKV